MRIVDSAAAQRTILRRPAWDEIEISDNLADSIAAIFGERIGADEAVRRICEMCASEATLHCASGRSVSTKWLCRTSWSLRSRFGTHTSG